MPIRRKTPSDAPVAGAGSYVSVFPHPVAGRLLIQEKRGVARGTRPRLPSHTLPSQTRRRQSPTLRAGRSSTNALPWGRLAIQKHPSCLARFGTLSIELLAGGSGARQRSILQHLGSASVHAPWSSGD